MQDRRRWSYRLRRSPLHPRSHRACTTQRPVSYTHLDVYKRQIDGISQKVLTDSLRQMMSDGLAYRHDYHEQPPRVEYGLTELGTKMLPIVNSLADFGNYYKSIIEQN